ncbi:MAG: NTP transferase domain-containing protein [Candidatus Omnitrophica bacterium]|nr:NTP transferase domain-containing protein [Candidatus Omnitrophota bacterium]
MRAVIMAGGRGKRLFPYTLVLPKPLVPIGKTPILEVVARQLADKGFNHITISVGYHAEIIMAVMGDGSKFGVKIDYSYEDQPLNTIGPLTLISGLDEPFLVMNGDLLTDLDYQDLYQYHLRRDSLVTVATYKRRVRLPLGVVQLNGENAITAFQEKPEFDYDVSMGVYVFNPDILSYVPKGQPFGFDHLILKLLDQNEKISSYPFDGNWLDMGTPEDLIKAMEEFESNPERYLPKQVGDYA